MNKEEQEAIEIFKGWLSYNKLHKEKLAYPDIIIGALETILNLIEKQQEEIEELKNNELDYTTIYINGKIDGEKKYKDKIKEKIQDLKEIIRRMDIEDIGRMLREEQILILEEILEENNNEY